MKKFLIICVGLCLLIGSVFYVKNIFYSNHSQKDLDYAKTEVIKLNQQHLLKDGDLIFQTSLSSQSKAIQVATNSEYSHCGIIFIYKGKYYVFEAVQPVKLTPLEQWIARGKNSHYVVKRLKNREQILTKKVLQKMQIEAKKFKGKSYDLAFAWSDDKIYCSELIWKIYKRATGLEIGKTQTMKDFNLSNKLVQAKLKERYGNKIPLNETVISPRAIFESDLLEIVINN